MTKTKDGVQPSRGRPGRRSASERLEAVKLLLAGKASVEQLSQKHAVTQETIEGWRAQGMEALEAALRPGGGSNGRDKELEQKVAHLGAALTRAVMEKELLQQALDIERNKRPTGPRRSR